MPATASPPKVTVLALAALYDARVAQHLATLTAAGFDVTYINWSRTRPMPALPGLERVRLVHRDACPVIGLNPFKFIRLLAWFYRQAVLQRADLYQIDDLFLLPLAPLLKLRTRAKIVFDIFENYLNWPGRMRTFARMMYPLCLPFVDAVVATHPASLPPSRRGHLNSLSAVIPNYPRRDSFDSAQQPPARDAVHVIYFGSLSSVDRDVTALLDLFNECLAHDGNLRFAVGGPVSGPDAAAHRAALERLAAQHPQRFEWCGEVPREEVIRRTRDADVGLILLKATSPNITGGSWTKIYEYLHAGVAVVATRGCDIAGEIEQNHAGLLFKPGVAGRFIAGELMALANNPARLSAMRTAARSMSTSYVWENVADRYLELYAKLGIRSEHR